MTTMKTTKQIATIALIILLGLIAYGLFRTSKSATALPTPGKPSQTGSGPAVDQGSLYTARHFVQMPTSAEELPWAQESLRLSDREMDLAFAAGVREAQEHPATLSVEAKQ